jgi:hypothetical protein
VLLVEMDKYRLTTRLIPRSSSSSRSSAKLYELEIVENEELDYANRNKGEEKQKGIKYLSVADVEKLTKKKLKHGDIILDNSNNYVVKQNIINKVFIALYDNTIPLLVTKSIPDALKFYQKHELLIELGSHDKTIQNILKRFKTKLKSYKFVDALYMPDKNIIITVIKNKKPIDLRFYMNNYNNVWFPNLYDRDTSSILKEESPKEPTSAQLRAMEQMDQLIEEQKYHNVLKRDISALMKEKPINKAEEQELKELFNEILQDIEIMIKRIYDTIIVKKQTLNDYNNKIQKYTELINDKQTKLESASTSTKRKQLETGILTMTDQIKYYQEQIKAFNRNIPETIEELELKLQKYNELKNRLELRLKN